MLTRIIVTSVVLGFGLAQSTTAQTITEIIDLTGDGVGNPLDGSEEIAVDGSGNVYVAGFDSDNAFKITPAGVITEIIDSTGDGAGNGLSNPDGIAVHPFGIAYVTGANSGNVFRIFSGGDPVEIIDPTGDGGGNGLEAPQGIAVDAAGNAYVAGTLSDNAFKIAPDEDGDGVPDADDICPNTPAGLPVDGEGRPLRDCNGDCLFNGGDIQCIVNELLNQ